MTNSDLANRALRLMDAEDWRGAIRLLHEKESEVRSDFELSWNLGWAYFKEEEDLESAAAWLTHACQLKPNAPAGRWALGEVLAASGKDAEAEYQLLLSLALRDAYLARARLGLILHKSGRLKEAEAIHLEGIRLTPDDGRRLGVFADFLSDIGREGEAKEFYEKAAKAGRPDDVA